jgi:hypothetical protein
MKNIYFLLKKCIIVFLLLSGSFLNAQVQINEIFASNASINIDTDYYNFSNWIEIYNPQFVDIDISGYYLSNDTDNLLKWQIPYNTIISANNFTYFWCDEKNNMNHTDFKIDADFGKIIISNESGVVVNSVSYSTQISDISFGRKPDGSNIWLYFQNPTLASSNIHEGFNDFSLEPVFDLNSGFYPSSFYLHISSPNAAMIRYTIDGSIPTEESSVYSSSILISQNTIVKARAFESNKIQSQVVTQSYFINEHQTNLPVVSISMNPEFLWDDMIGIYVEGTNGITGTCIDYNVNFNQEWERAMHFELFDNNGNNQFSSDVGTEIAGGCSRGYPCKSMKILSRAKYGENKLAYKFFNDKPFTEYKRLLLRNSGNDWGWSFTMIRDATMQTLVKGCMDIDYQEYQPVAVYLNNEYWGLMELREKADQHYIETNYGIESDSVDLIEIDIPKNGDPASYWNMIEFMENNSLFNQENYEWIKTQMDIDEYINYQIAQIYFANTDWPGNNIKFWRNHSEGGKWRWILYDTDFGFGLATEVSHNTLSFAMDSLQSDWPNPEWSTFLFRKLLANQEFKQQFIQKFIFHINSTFEPDRVINIIDSMQSNIAAEMPYHCARWGGNMDDWQYNIQVMRDFAVNRPDYVIQHISEVFGLSEFGNLTVIKNAGGEVFIDNSKLLTDTFSGIFFAEYPLQISAENKPGYVFLKWVKETANSEADEFISQGEMWNFFDLGYIPSADWYQTDYDDASWSSGNAQFGYGDGDESTIINFGPDENNKYTTTYFRTSFNVENVEDYENLYLELLRDDGAVVYLNGNEILRSNMPDGIVNFETFSTDVVGYEDEYYFFPFEISTEYLVEGINYLAVEIHQNSLNSSDISFDFQLHGIKNTSIISEEIYDSEITEIVTSNTTLKAYFEPVELVTDLYINEFMADNLTTLTDANGEYDDWIEFYNSGNQIVNIGGLYVTDSIPNLTKYVIPTTSPELTEIEAGGFLLTWADKQTFQGVLHFNIKLSKAGEQIAISQIVGMDTLIIDSITFGTQITDLSYGLYPNGSEIWEQFSQPTPGSSNVLLLVDENSENQFIIYPNPANNFVNIDYNGEEDFDIEIFDLTGRKVINDIHCVNSKNNIDLYALNQGLYIVKISQNFNEELFKLSILK